MRNESTQMPGGWKRLDKAAFGIVYGAITVLSILMAIGDHSEAPFETAAILFGSVLAVTMAKAFSELLAHAIDTGERLTRSAWRAAWRHSSPSLSMAILPALMFLSAGLGMMTVELAVGLSQLVSVAILLLIGARVGWVIDRRHWPAIAGALFAGGIGLALAGLKYVIH
jgi:archaellum biogenesis protein FlaJ (TadC family)